jgi:hypothetical protein
MNKMTKIVSESDHKQTRMWTNQAETQDSSFNSLLAVQIKSVQGTRIRAFSWLYCLTQTTWVLGMIVVTCGSLLSFKILTDLEVRLWTIQGKCLKLKS